MFHGAGDTGRGIESGSALDDWSDRLGFIVVYPDAVQEARGTWALGCSQCTWADAAGIDDYRFVRELVDTLSVRYSIDRQGIFVAGHSLGGSFAFDVACHEPELIAGAAIVSSLPSVEELPLCRDPTKPMRIITSIGDSDPNVPWLGGVGGSGASYQSADATATKWAARNGCSGSASDRALLDRNGDGAQTHVLEYVQCPSAAFVRFFRVARTGHEWPRSTDFDVSAELANSFFGK